jgi:hypothetical protein
LLFIMSEMIIPPVLPQDPPENVDIATHLQQQFAEYNRTRVAERAEDQARHRAEREEDRQLASARQAALESALTSAQAEVLRLQVAGADRLHSSMLQPQTFPVHLCPPAFSALAMSALPVALEPKLLPMLDIRNHDLFMATEAKVTTMRTSKKFREEGRWQGHQSELPVLLTGMAVNAYLQLLLAKVIDEVRREDADREAIAAALEGSATYFARWGGLLLATRRTQLALDLEYDEIMAAGYADQAFGRANSLVGDVSADPIAQSILAAQATAKTARLAKEMVTPAAAEPATKKPAWHKNQNKFAKAAGKGAQGAPKLA